MRHFLGSIILLALPLLACGERPSLSRIHWTPDAEQPLTPEIATLISSPHKDEMQESSIGKFRSQHWRAMASGFPIEGSWVKVLRDSQGHPQLINGDIPSLDPTPKELAKAQQLQDTKEKILGQAWNQFPELRAAKRILPAQVLLMPEKFGFKPVLELVYFSHNETDVIRLRMNSRGKLLDRQSVAHHLTTGSAQVFPAPSDHSQLAEVFFNNLVGDGTLTNPIFRVESVGQSRAFSPSHHFMFSPDEQAFDEVQAYYFVEQILDWLKTQFSFSLPSSLTLKVHVGGITPSNAAFFYGGIISLGDGDNVVYKKIPRDPSIVIHEVIHAVVQALAGLPSDKEGGSLNEAYADFITASFLDNPRMAEYSYLKGPFRRNLENDLKAYKDFTRGLYHDSMVVSGTLWDIRKIMGKDQSTQLAIQSLGRLGAGSQLADFPRVVRESLVDLKIDSQVVDAVNGVLRNKGW